MFQQLRQGGQLYLLHKSEQPTLEVAQVTAVGQPRPRYQNQYNSFLPVPGQELFVDITVKTGEQSLDLGGLPAGADIVDLTASGKPIVVTTSRESMLAQVENMLVTSRQIVESVDYHRGVVQGCEAILQQLNPQLAERKAHEQQMDRMNREVGNVKSELGELKSMLAKLINQGMSRGEGEKKQPSVPNPKN